MVLPGLWAPTWLACFMWGNTREAAKTTTVQDPAAMCTSQCGYSSCVIPRSKHLADLCVPCCLHKHPCKADVVSHLAPTNAASNGNLNDGRHGRPLADGEQVTQQGEYQGEAAADGDACQHPDEEELPQLRHLTKHQATHNERTVRAVQNRLLLVGFRTHFLMRQPCGRGYYCCRSNPAELNSLTHMQL